MKETNRKWHLDVLQLYQALMYDTLIQPHNIITETRKIYTMENPLDGTEETMTGFLAMKDYDGKKTKYFIDDGAQGELPIKANKTEEFLLRDNARVKSIIQKVTQYTPFRIRPAPTFKTTKEMIDMIASFEHTEPDYWTLNKMVAIMGFVGKTFCGICSKSEFGKSSIYQILDTITKKCPVFQPRSVPGILAQITEDGNIVFDETHDASGEVMNCMENFSLQVAGNAPMYVNGAMKSRGLKAKYAVSQQSITFLYNEKGNYHDPTKQFFDFVWKNTKAMDSRFLKLKFEGKLLEQFDKGFDMVQEAQANKMVYVNIAKHLLWLKQEKISNSYQRKYAPSSPVLSLSGRKKIIFDEITWLIDQYAMNQEEYDLFYSLLENTIKSYKDMVFGRDAEESSLEVREEII